MSTKDQKPNELDSKILEDFHGNAPVISESFQGVLPTLTNTAKIFITDYLEDGKFFRFGVVGGGCAGFNYLMDEDESQTEDDIVFCEAPLAVIDKESLKYCGGAEIDLEKSPFGSSLIVNNPGAKSSCGCGTSFSYDF